MHRFEIKGSSGLSTVMVGESLINMHDYLPAAPPVIITDKNVRRLYEDLFPKGHIIEIGMGEGIKNLQTIEEIFAKLLALEVGRGDFIVGIGGGIVCDIAGFASSTYQRGVRFGFAPTTLLAQVDASVGGKNGVNFSGYKNMVGVFNQPDFVICDPSVLQTLSSTDRGCGLAEVVKHGAIADHDLFVYLEENVSGIMSLSPSAVDRMVHDSVAIKSQIVSRDEKEAGERRKLNFGHTLAHAVEKVYGLPHGEAVSIGMMAAAKFSAIKGYLSREETGRLETLLTAFELPTRLAIDPSKIMEAMRHDKKREKHAIHFVLLQSLGSAVVESVTLEELESVLDDIT